MITRVPKQASAIEYPYLWLGQANSGETEGRKARPVCLALSVQNAQSGEHHLLLLAISSQPPRPDQRAIEIPETERRRAGPTEYSSALIVTSEYNYDIAERSFYYDTNGRVLGDFSPRFMARIAVDLRARLRLAPGRENRSS
jgi:hypothetical protein